MEDLIILGAGGTSREIADTVGDINRIERRWNLLGFLDDDAAKHGKTVGGLPVLGSIDCAKQYAARCCALHRCREGGRSMAAKEDRREACPKPRAVCQYNLSLSHILPQRNDRSRYCHPV